MKNNYLQRVLMLALMSFSTPINTITKSDFSSRILTSLFASSPVFRFDFKKYLLWFIVTIFFALPQVTKAQYCTPLVENCALERITNVTFSEINNSTGCTIYGDYTAMVANVSRDDTIQISVQIIADVYEYLYVFIDWNQNEVLNDPGEVYTLAENVSAPGPYTANITIPMEADLGNTRMRVLLGFAESTPNPCQIFSGDGEVEDYTVNITENPNACLSVVSPTTTFITQESAHLSWSLGDAETQWEVTYGAPGFDPDTEVPQQQSTTTLSLPCQA